MATMKLNAPVRANGRLTTIAQLADEGLITFSCCKVETRKVRGERHERMAYFADLPDGSGWEISRTAYLSRTGQEVRF
jgi:hypothetical protein